LEREGFLLPYGAVPQLEEVVVIERAVGIDPGTMTTQIIRDTGAPPGSAAAVLRRGYADRVGGLLRPATVAVAGGPGPGDHGASAKEKQ
jgi:hypothetical protein